MKDVPLNEWTPKQVLNPTLNPKIAHFGPKMSRTPPKVSQKSNVRIEGNKENKSGCSI